MLAASARPGSALYRQEAWLELALFYFTCVVLLVSVGSFSLCLSTFIVTRRKTYGLAAVAFLSYFFDVLMVFQDYYLFGGSFHEIADAYYVGQPFGLLVTGLGVLASIWLIVCVSLDIRHPAWLIGPCVAFCLASAAVWGLLPSGNVRLFAFVTMREAFLLWSLAVLLAKTALSSDAFRSRMRKRIPFFAVGALLVVCVVVENVLTMFVVPSDGLLTGLVAILPERNIAENVLLLWCAAWIWMECYRVLSIHFRQPPVMSEQRHLEAIHAGMDLYAERLRLTGREKDVLLLVLQGKDNQNIASELQLSPSTVKVHVHNILKKANRGNRQELISDFMANS